MADTMQFDLVSPERRLASIEAREVQIPGMDGDMTAMPDHSPLITTLRPGILTVVSAEGETRYAVTGGFAEVTAEGTSVLAEQAIPVADLTSEAVNAMVDEAKEGLKTAQPEQVDALNKLVADLGALASQAGLSL
jgi:F-type H+-transporting ATPase subunit epsilon